MPRSFCAFIKASLKFGFLVQYFVTFLFRFSILIFHMEFNSAFTIIEIGLFYGGKQSETKIITGMHTPDIF